MEDDAAQARELGTAGLQRIASALDGLLRPDLDLALDVLLAVGRLGVVKSAVGGSPVAVGRQDGGQLVRLALGPIEVAADIMAGITGEEDLFNGVPSRSILP
jgi:hypothetical protein